MLDVSEMRDQPLVLINPEILSKDGEGPGEEGCLSLPGIYDKLSRATHIRVRAIGRDGRPFEMGGVIWRVRREPGEGSGAQAQ